MERLKEKWNDILNRLKIEYEISDIAFKTWILSISIYRVEDDMIYFLVPEQQKRDLIRKKYSDQIKVTIAEVLGEEYDIDFLIESELADQVDSSKKETLSSKSTTANRSTLNTKYTFDTFIVGKNNEFAHSAALAVAEMPGETYNPLYIYGGPGLGKTHLMHAIGNYILDANPDMKVLCVTSEEFTNEVIESIRFGNKDSMSKLRDKYRNIDVLLIDDIQFIIGKESTQEEFFHTFNHLHGLKKQIVITSDKAPKDIDNLDDRFRSRFEWGLMGDISKPDFETKVAILRKKAELDGFEIYDGTKVPTTSDYFHYEIIKFIASNIKSNIRELEGAFTKLVAYSRLHNIPKKEITIDYTKDALKDYIFADSPKQITASLIIETVAEHYNVTIKDLESTKKSKNIATPRFIAMYLCRTLTDTSLKDIGALLGGRDHTTILNGIKNVDKGIANQNEDITKNLEIIKKKIIPN